MTLSAAASVQAGAFTCSLPASAQARNPFTSARATMKSQSVAAYWTSSACCAVVAVMSVERPAAEATEDRASLSFWLVKILLRRPRVSLTALSRQLTISRDERPSILSRSATTTPLKIASSAASP